MNERLELVKAFLAGEESMSELCSRFGIARKTGYKWVRRFESEGESGLADRSRAPRSHPQAIAAPVAKRLVEVRQAHPNWGPLKVLAWLKPRQPELDLPAASSVGELFSRLGLSHPRRRVRRTPPSESPLGHAGTPNAVWCADYKGQFRTGDGRLCFPLTISDANTRYFLRCVGMPRIDSTATHAVFDAAFREFGRPEAIRTDNGVPFAANSAGGLSRLSVWFVKLQIRVERIEPGRPDQNGRHERLHRTLKAETARPPRRSLRAQQNAFNAFRKEFNEERPHQALDQRTPASLYVVSARDYPCQLWVPEYVDDWDTRLVSRQGYVKWRGRDIFVTKTLAKERVGFEPIDDGRWRMHYGPIQLGVVDERLARLGLIRPTRVRGRRKRTRK